MVIDMNEAQVRTVEQVRQVLEGTQELEFRLAEDDEGRYGWIAAVLKRFEYRQLPRADHPAGVTLGGRQGTGQAIPRPGERVCTALHGRRRGAAEIGRAHV